MAFMSFKNLTLGLLDDGVTIIIDSINNKITGSLGIIFNKLFVHKNKRECNLKSISLFRDDINSNNNSNNFDYLGTILLNYAKNELADVYYFPYEFDYRADHLETTKVTLIEGYQLIQFLPKSTKYQRTDLSTLLLNNKNVLLLILIGFCLASLSNLIFTKLINFRKIKILNIKPFNLLFLNYNQLFFLSFKIALLKLFFNLFIFINLIFLINSINTDKIIINTDDFLNTDHKLLRTDKKFVFKMNDENKFRLSDKNSLLFKLYQKKVNQNDNYFGVPFTMNDKDKKKFNSITSLSFKFYQNKEFIYLNDQNYLEILLSYHIRKSLKKEIKKMLHWSTNQYFENGIYLEFQSSLYNEVYKFLNDRNVPLIFSVKQYIDQEREAALSFSMENFKNIFNLFISILMIILLIFIINLIYKFYKLKNISFN